MHLVGFIIRIYHDARSPERQIPHLRLWLLTPLLTVLKNSFISSQMTVLSFRRIVNQWILKYLVV